MISADSRRWWALASLSLSVLVVALDLFVLTLALPTVSADLHASSSDLQWFVAAYSLVLAAALLPAGLLGGRVGRQRGLARGLALFGGGSLAFGGFLAGLRVLAFVRRTDRRQGGARPVRRVYLSDVARRAARALQRG